MDSRTWAYGPNGEAQIFDSPEDVPKGWSDTPASTSKAEEPVNAGEEAGDFLATLDDMPEKEAKLALDEWAEREHGIKLDRRRSLTKMLAQLEEALNGDSD